MENDTLPPLNWRGALLLAALLAGIVCIAWWRLEAPRPLPADAPPNEFSAERAWNHINTFATQPHPFGSPENRKVHDYIVDTIRGMGIEPDLFHTLLPSDVRQPDYEVQWVENILVRLKGTEGKRAILLMAHYDSVPYGPGAADDGSGVATLLETLRALLHEPKLKNDLIFFFTDGEEGGLLGPKCLLRHPWYNDIALCLNFEARGHYGASMMFETSEENGWLVSEMLKVVPRPVANSFMFEVAGRMPTTTDYKILKREGMPGLNFAFIGGIKYYHTANDSPEKLSKATLQHHGSYALPLARHFGNADLADVTAPPLIYFNAFGPWIIAYPMHYARPIALLLTAAMILLFALGIAAKRLSLTGILAGLLALPGVALIVALLVGALMLLAWLRFQAYMIYNSDLFFFGFAALTLCVFTLVYGALRSRFAAQDLFAGALLWWAAQALLLAFTMPGGSFIAAWPLAGGLLALAALLLPAAFARPGLMLAALLIGALPALTIIAPMLHTLSLAVTIIPAPIWMVLLVMVLGLLAPLLLATLSPNRLWLPTLSSAAAAFLLALAFFWFRFTPDYPRMTHLCYGMNCNTGEAWWLSNETTLDDWLKWFFPDDNAIGSPGDFRPAWENLRVRRAPAPPADLPQPEVEILSDTLADNRRHLSLRIHSRRLAPVIQFGIAPGTPIYGAAVQGQPLGPAEAQNQSPEGREWLLQWRGRSPEGIRLDLILDAGSTLPLTVRETSFGVPGPLGPMVPPRPENRITQNNVIQFWYPFHSNQLMTRKTFDL